MVPLISWIFVLGKAETNMSVPQKSVNFLFLFSFLADVQACFPGYSGSFHSFGSSHEALGCLFSIAELADLWGPNFKNMAFFLFSLPSDICLPILFFS